MIIKLFDFFMEMLFGVPVPPTPTGKAPEPIVQQQTREPSYPYEKKKSDWKNRNAREQEQVIPPGEAADEDLPLEEVKAYHRSQVRYTEDELLTRAIDFKLLTGQWPTKAGSVGGSWHPRWEEASKHVGLPGPKTYYKRFGSLSNAWEAAEARLLAPPKESCENR